MGMVDRGQDDVGGESQVAMTVGSGFRVEASGEAGSVAANRGETVPHDFDMDVASHRSSLSRGVVVRPALYPTAYIWRVHCERTYPEGCYIRGNTERIEGKNKSENSLSQPVYSIYSVCNGQLWDTGWGL